MELVLVLVFNTQRQLGRSFQLKRENVFLTHPNVFTNTAYCTCYARVCSAALPQAMNNSFQVRNIRECESHLFINRTLLESILYVSM